MAENDELNATLMEHSAMLGRALERLDLVDASRQAFDTASSGIGDLAQRIETLATTQGEVLERLTRLEAGSAISEEGKGIDETLVPDETAPPTSIENEAEGSQGSFLSRVHRTIG